MSTNVEEIVNLSIAKKRPRFRRGIKPTSVKDIYDCMVWYYPNGIDDPIAIVISNRCNPVDAPWETMEAEAVKDYWFPNWRTLAKDDSDKIQNEVQRIVTESHCMWKSVFST